MIYKKISSIPFITYPRSQPTASLPACHLSHRRAPYIQTAPSLSRKPPQSSRSLSTCPEEPLSTTAPQSCMLLLQQSHSRYHVSVCALEVTLPFHIGMPSLLDWPACWTAWFMPHCQVGIQHGPQEPCGPTGRAARAHCPRELAKQARKGNKRDHLCSIQQHRRMGDGDKEEVYSSGTRSPNGSPAP